MRKESKKEGSTKSADSLIVISEVPEVQSAPDKYTKQDPIFFDGGAPNQVFRLHLGFVSYGTDDKAHAASMILSIMLGLIFLGAMLVGLFVDREWVSDAIKIIGTAFTITAGVAIGKGSKSE